jgi:fatty acid desaturase
MPTVDPQAPAEINLREQLARIDNLLIDTQKKQRESHLAPWQVFATMLGGYAAALAGGAALGSWLFGR